jgi:hypothetical protein
MRPHGFWFIILTAAIAPQILFGQPSLTQQQIDSILNEKLGDKTKQK